MRSGGHFRNGWKRLVVALGLALLVISGGGTHEVTAVEDSYEQLKVFTEVLSLVQANYVEETKPRDLIYSGIKGMLESLDPHSAFMPPDIFKEMQVETQGSFGGLGIEITVKDRMLTVVAPIEGTPADRAGIHPGDRIVKIDGSQTKDMTLMEAVKKLRGPKGTSVTLTILREESPGPFELTLVREVIEVKSVKTKDLGDGIVYVRISAFQERTGKDLLKAIEQLGQGAMSAMVLDLRNNPGGLLNQAVQVSDLFLDQGQLIVYTEGRIKNQDLRFSAEHGAQVPKIPIVVLVNGGSASASEIVAGALQDWKRAVILGTKTFGKGSVQTVVPLSDGSGLRLTTAKYFTPKGRSIHGTGLVPDIIVEVPRPTAVAKAPGGPGEKEGEPIKVQAEKRQEKKISEEEGDASLQIGKREGPDPNSDIQLKRAMEILKASRIIEKGFVKGNAG
ncbi:S41 family peptidase [Candidatus Methylomirabilis sp.]|uniref:S41 family peptidase n=1 Tax=Candidatus Methylomirabilis sp. TaxID=2032687 RepID=UPI002A6132E1|nr:S41 family peptidase [Candidatus Methylomirabilis sp.]